MSALNADEHAVAGGRPSTQDKRSVIAIEIDYVDAWLFGTDDVARSLARLPPMEVFDAGPV